MKIDIPLQVLQSMKKIVDIYIQDESKHYDELNNNEYLVEERLQLNNHIYNDLELVNRFLHSQELQADIDLAERDFWNGKTIRGYGNRNN